MLVVLYSLNLGLYRLKIFENRVLRRLSGRRRDKITRDLEKNE